MMGITTEYRAKNLYRCMIKQDDLNSNAGPSGNLGPVMGHRNQSVHVNRTTSGCLHNSWGRILLTPHG